ncbi:hypothetical protein PS673_04728 [Pseudomonas fluorescens]|uniref:6-methylsalicylate decarboxylase n=1 Tax=Pseudomonas fluorescens TaxID=294 RepID=A0A5E6WLH6_PSEFL|nr:amidohydrolase family protein [Pseudomonas fluorescens]VVN29334.1 hypothetical protein PS673_04728 [Pseudomonas fluorescens]
MTPASRKPAGLIDVHHHILPPDYVAAVGADYIGSQGSSGRLPKWNLGESLELMDEAGIAAAIVSISSPGVGSLAYDSALAVARKANEFAANMTTLHPSRFGMFATIPLRGDDHAAKSIDASIEEVRFALDELDADGICLLSNYHGKYLGDALFAPLHEYLEHRGAVVFVHPTLPSTRLDISGLSQSMLEFPFETTRTITTLLVEGVIASTPSVRWIFSHAGGAFPYLVGRLEVLLRNNKRLSEQLGGNLYELVKGLYFDMALSVDAAHMNSLLSVVPPSHVLFGSDYPFGPPGQMSDTSSRLKNLDGLEDVRAALTAESDTSLFRRFHAHAQ